MPWPVMLQCAGKLGDIGRVALSRDVEQLQRLAGRPIWSSVWWIDATSAGAS